MNTQIVRNSMTPHPITITPPTTLPKARCLMLDHHLRNLPVVSEGKLVGVVALYPPGRGMGRRYFGGYESNSLPI